MAGRGPAPKDPARRARANKDPIATTVLRWEAAKPPRFPATRPDGQPWPAATKAWWRTWLRSPQAEHFGSTDWSYLLDSALLHAAFVDGDLKQAAELRLRLAKFGATPEDRMRLRMGFAAADEMDARRAPPGDTAKQRYGDLRVLPSPAAKDG